jgi:nucleotide-binding universal stress UspA family protein
MSTEHKCILVPTDFSETAGRALDFAVEEARRRDADLELLHVHVPPVHWGADAVIPLQIDDGAGPAIEAALARTVNRVRERGIACEARWVTGTPWLEIVLAAAGHCELIVMGTHGRTGIRHVLLGSVAERVVQHARRPVLIVPPPDDERPPPRL